MSDAIDKLSRRRRIVLATYGIAFLAFQSLFFGRLDAPFAVWRPVDWLFAAGYAVWAASLILLLATGVFIVRGRTPEARAALNDELTAANRRFAYRAGYWMLMGGIVVIYVLSRFTDWTLEETLRLLFAFGVAMPAVAFAGKEREQGA